MSILDDDTLEIVESFDVTLERTPDLDSRITLDPVNGVLEIIDNDGRYDYEERDGFNVPNKVLFYFVRLINLFTAFILKSALKCIIAVLAMQIS